jgi:hypothetical protein
MKVYVCQACAAQFTRARRNGNPPKFCSECRRNPRTSTLCSVCGKRSVAQRCTYCSPECAGLARRNPNKAAQVREYRARKRREAGTPTRSDLRGAFRRAVEDGEGPDKVFAALRELCVEDARGCWVWQRATKGGYPLVRWAGKQYGVHRLALEVQRGVSLGVLAAHHTCAQPSCVNPSHLQAVTAQQNTAEMLERRAYVARIRELEDALASVAPEHPLLAQYC